MPPTLDIQKTFAEIQSHYANDPVADKINLLALGDFGTGKSTLLSTLPKPIHVMSFDPGGMRGAFLKPLIDSGQLLVERFEDEDNKSPTQFARFEARMDVLASGGWFSSGVIKSFGIDSFTTMSDACMNFVLKKGGRAGQVPQLQDYMLQQMLLQQVVKKCTSLPVHFMLTAHLKNDKDEVSGRILNGINTSKGLEKKIPLLFDEIYVTLVENDPKGSKYVILTGSEGFYRARTRIGAGKFELKETPNLTELFKKGGITTA